MGNTPTTPMTPLTSAPSAPPKAKLKKSKSRIGLKLRGNKSVDPKTDARTSIRPLTPDPLKNHDNVFGDPTIPDDELDALKQTCLSHIESLMTLINFRNPDETPEQTFAILKTTIGKARDQLSRYTQSTVNQFERPQSAQIKKDEDIDWADIDIDFDVPLPPDVEQDNLSPPNAKESASGSSGNVSDSPELSYEDGKIMSGVSVNSSLEASSNLRRYRNSSTGDRDMPIIKFNNSNTSDRSMIDYIGSLTLDDKHFMTKNRNGDSGSGSGSDKSDNSNSGSDDESKTESNEEKVGNENDREIRNILDDSHGIQHPFIILDNICLFLLVSERFLFGTCNKSLYKNIGNYGFSFDKQFQMDNIYWAQHFDQYCNENNDSLELWNGEFHKLDKDRIVQMKYFLIFYHHFTDHRKITNFKAIIPSDLETLVISGHKMKNEAQRRRLSRFIGSVVGHLDGHNMIDWLYLENNYFIDEDIQCISRGLLKRTSMSNLCLLSFDDNTNITDKCIPVLLEAIGQKGRRLQFLSLKNCKSLKNACCEAIVSFYKRYHGSTRLHEINLSKNKRIGERGINLLDNLIKNKKHLPKNDNFVLFKIIIAGCGFRKRQEGWSAQLEG